MKIRLPTMVFVLHNAYSIFVMTILSIGVLNQSPATAGNKGLLLIPLICALIGIGIIIYLMGGMNQYKKWVWLPAMIITCLDVLLFIGYLLLIKQVSGLMQIAAIWYLFYALIKERPLYTK